MSIQKIFADREYVNAQINAIPNPIIIEEVTENIYVLENSDIDATLSVTGKVADAKVVGDKINLIFDEIEKINRDSIIEEVIAALGTPVFGRVDEENNIILTGELAAGEYVLKYEGADGNVENVGTIVVGKTIENRLKLAVNADNTEFVGPNGEDGYKPGYRLNSSGTETAQSGMNVTGYIPVAWGDDVYLSGITMSPKNSSTGKYVYVNLYGSDFASRGRITGNNNAWPAASDSMEMDADGNVVRFTLDSANFEYVSDTNVGYLRLSAQGIDDRSIIATEPIE